MTTVPVSQAVPDRKEPVGVTVTVNPLLGQVIVQIGEFSVGLPPEDALLMANHLAAAVQALQSIPPGRPQ